MKYCNCGTRYNINFYKKCPSCCPSIIKEGWERQDEELKRKVDKTNQYHLQVKKKTRPISHKSSMMIRLLDSDYQYYTGYFECYRFN